MMKRLFVIFMLIVLLLGGCSQAQPQEVSEESYEELTKNPLPQNSLEYLWLNSRTTYKGDIIPDVKTAKEVAEQIFERRGLRSYYQDYVVTAVDYYEKEDAWFVLLGKPYKEGHLVLMGGGYTIVLRKKDGAVLRMWPGE